MFKQEPYKFGYQKYSIRRKTYFCKYATSVVMYMGKKIC